MDRERGVIRVTATRRGMVVAARARLHVTVEGERLAFGDAALQASGELADLVGRLKELGIAGDEISVSGVHSSTRSGLLTKETRTVYTVVVGVADTSRMGEYLRAVSVHKGAVSNWVEWVYEEEAAAAALAAEALRDARGKADLLAAAAEAEVVGLKAASDAWSMPQDLSPAAPRAAAMQTRGGGEQPLDIGTDFTSRREIATTVTADFWIAPRR
jgi:uncharacterized protein YggE